ncbi:MAG: hypothetical protein NWF05_01780 [Candidatus Bathyarchaeota archaeon]|nr:hypothetical protein [Candidatus Bathyarchaeota archaeon]
MARYSAKNLTKVGVLVLAVGLVFLAGTFYRTSTTWGSGSVSNLFGLAPQTTHLVKASPFGESDAYIWPPSNLRLDVQANGTLDVHIVDQNGITQWNKNHVVDSVWAAYGIQQEIFNLHLNGRGPHTFLVYNPSEDIVHYEISYTAYGLESDLLYVSVVLTLSGLVVTVAGLLLSWKNRKNRNPPINKQP